MVLSLLKKCTFGECMNRTIRTCVLKFLVCARVENP